MMEGSGNQGDIRGFWARSGIVALNLPAPGLGLIRVGDWRAGIPFLLAPFAFLALTTIGMGRLPITDYNRAVSAFIAILALIAALYFAAAAWTWRKSKVRSDLRPWSRWYGLVLIFILIVVAMQLAQSLAHSFYKPFYAPSESMAPTIGKGDKFIGAMRWRGPFQRGDIIIFHAPDGVRVSRIAAIAGDRIAMRGGVPIVNGVAARQDSRGRTSFTAHDGLHAGLMLAERLPGEDSIHPILYTGPSEFDDMAEIVVPANRLFVLGDNRERSADSRVPIAYLGVGLVPESAVIGRPIYIDWSSDRAKVGTRLDR